MRHNTTITIALSALLACCGWAGTAAPSRAGSGARSVATGRVSSAAHTPRVRCRPGPGTSTIARSRKARIFADHRTGNDYACLYSNGHAHLLSTTEHWEYRVVRFSGHYVAFVAFVEAANAYIGVMNLTTGHLLRVREEEEAAPIELPASECPSAAPRCVATCPQIESLVLKSDGAIAWIAVNFPPPAGPGQVFRGCGSQFAPTIEVRLYDRHGLRTVGKGSGIVPTSLHLNGTKVQWTEDGHQESAAIL